MLRRTIAPQTRTPYHMPDRHRLKIWSLAACIAIAAVLTYLNGCDGEFLYDDLTYITRNPVVASGKIASAFTQPLPPDQPHLGLFRPLTVATWTLQAKWQGFNAVAFHGVNVVLHATVSVLVLMLGIALGAATAGAFVGALLFAVHPVHVESVTWITGRSELLAAMFLLLALIAWLRSRSPIGAMVLTSTCVAAAAMSKENAFTFPLLLVAVAMGVQRLDRRLLAALVAAVLMLGAIALWRIAVLGRFSPEASLAPFVNESLGKRLLIPFDLLAGYIKLLLWPGALRIFYHRTEFGIPGVAHALILVGFTVVVVLAWRRDRRIAALLAWFLAALVPVLNIVPIQETFAERFWYLPSIGLCLACGQAIAHLGRWEQRRLGSLATAVLVPAAAVTLCFMLAVQRNRDWRTSLTLWEAQARVAPQFAYSHYQLGYYYLEHNLIEPNSAEQRGAIAELLESLRIDANHRYAPEAHRELGKLFYGKRQWQTAAFHFREAWQFDPNDFTALINLVYCARYVPSLLTEDQRRTLLEQAHHIAPDDEARRLVEEEQARPPNAK